MLAMRIKRLPSTPQEVKDISARLGLRIRAARIRRKLRQEDLAERSGLSRSTIQSIEKGDAACSVGGLFTVLWTLGISAEIDLIADPGLDRDGLALSLDSSSKRVYIPRVVDNDF